MKKRVIILGSTGSIGRNTLSVLRGIKEDWNVVGLAAGTRWRDLASQAAAFDVDAVAISDDSCTAQLEAELGGSRVFGGPEAMLRLIEDVECDCVVSGVVGTAGLQATIRAIELGRRIALANKEAMVIAGSLLMPLAERYGAEIIPVDSEHSAILQSMQSGLRDEVSRIFLTASGGALRTWTREALEQATPEDALRHPNWEMGPKITIDSATMMNKALEIVEAHWLFGLDVEQIQVLVHPESIIHSCVEFCDGSMIAQLGEPDMRLPIQYALSFPQRVPGPAPRLDLATVGQLNFEAPDQDQFPAIRLGYEAASRGGTCGAVLNAANEEAVALFQRGAIGFMDIARQVENALAQHKVIDSPNLEAVIEADRWARNQVSRCEAC
ncbi:MAG: 1-deoxy-D-xylulose-5-phosphate reductoisomerase [Planctomycetota bacterium]|jgi:1-deoxy-D-xylulose-5-phosphate reductoisomerase